MIDGEITATIWRQGINGPSEEITFKAGDWMEIPKDTPHFIKAGNKDGARFHEVIYTVHYSKNTS